MEFVYKSQAEIADMTDEQREDYAVKKREHEESLIEKKAKEEAEKLIEKAKEEAKKETEELLKKSKDEYQKELDKVSAQVKKYSQTSVRRDVERSSFNDNLEEAIKENKEAIQGFKKGQEEMTISLKAVGDMSISANFPGATPFIQDVRPGLIESPYNRVWLGDLLPAGTSQGNSLLYPKENGGEGGAGLWTDKEQDKSQMDFDLTTESAFFKWIAGTVVVEREMLDDIPWLISYLRNKMLVSLKTAENDFILNGSSDSNPVTGLLDAATDYDGDFTTPVDRIIDAGWGQIVEDTFDFYNPTHTILTPRDSVKIGLNKADGSKEYDLPAGSVAFANGQLSVGGLTVAKTTQIGSGNFLTFDRNATMFVKRTQPEIRMFEDWALAKKNKVGFRIEERATLTIFNNEALVKGELEASG